MDEPEMRRRVTEAAVARVGTLDEHGRAHLVPVLLVIDGNTIYAVTDSSQRSQQARNLERDARVSVLIDSYEQGWSNAWWVRIRGTGHVLPPGSGRERARELLREKYPVTADETVDGVVLAVDIERWTASN